MYCDDVEVTHHSGEALPWTPWEIAPGIDLKLLKVDPVHGLMVVLMRIPESTKLGRHRHTGFVHVYTIQGSWHYLEHDWVSRTGDFVYETSDSIHSFETFEGEDTIIYASLNGTLEFMDDTDKVIHVESWRTMLERQKAFMEKHGMAPIDVSSFVPR